MCGSRKSSAFLTSVVSASLCLHSRVADSRMARALDLSYLLTYGITSTILLPRLLSAVICIEWFSRNSSASSRYSSTAICAAFCFSSAVRFSSACTANHENPCQVAGIDRRLRADLSELRHGRRPHRSPAPWDHSDETL